MGRDLEISSYFPHVVLDRRRVVRLFKALAATGLRVGAPDPERYPLLDAVTPAGAAGVRIAVDDVEDLLRSRSGAVPLGHGFIPLLGRVPGVAGPAVATMQFSIHSAAHPELDGLRLRFDDASLRPPATDPDDPVGPGWQAVLTWYGVICDQLRVAYGYGDWEDLFLQTVIPPSRRDVLNGRVDMLYRVNCFGPALVGRYGRMHILATPAAAVVGLRYGGVLIGEKLRYHGDDDEQFRRAAAHLQLRTRADQLRPA